MIIHRSNSKVGKKKSSRIKTLFRSKKRFARYSILTANVAMLAGIAVFISRAPQNVSSFTRSSSESTVAGPLDQLSSADIASHIAGMVALPEQVDVQNYADSVNAELSIIPADTAVVSKPLVASTTLKSGKDVQTYKVAEGDTVSKIAEKLGVSSDSIKWSNNLNSDVVEVGKEITVPPKGLNGIVYTVQPGDTVDSLADKYKANKDLLISMNDAEVGGIKPGQRIFLPEAVIVAAPVYVAPARSRLVSATPTVQGGFAFGNAPIYGRNGYVPGYCTWGVAAIIPVPANWGNANTWALNASRSGWTVSKTPSVGSIAQRSGGYGGLGHVAIVTAVSADGSMIRYKDMNGLAGFGRYGETASFVSASEFSNYITR